MQRTLLSRFTLCLILLFASFAPGETASPAKPAVPKGWKFSFPDGDPKAGKAAL